MKIITPFWLCAALFGLMFVFFHSGENKISKPVRSFMIAEAILFALALYIQFYTTNKFPPVILAMFLAFLFIMAIYPVVSKRLFDDKLLLHKNADLEIFPQYTDVVKDAFQVPNIEGYRTYNPSITKDPRDNDIFFTFRVSNYTLCTDMPNKGPNKRSWANRSDIKSFIIISDDKGRTIAADMPGNSPDFCVQGYEDPRPFFHENKLCIFSNCLIESTRKDLDLLGRSDKCMNQMWLSTIDKNTLSSVIGSKKTLSLHNIPLTIDFAKGMNQKNWMPFSTKDGIFCVYSINPHVILKVDENTGKCVKIAETYSKIISPDIRGGSQVVLYALPDGSQRYIAVTHRRTGDVYTTQMYMFSTEYPYEITHYTNDFIFGKTIEEAADVQFASGLAILDDVANITYGEQDCHSKICRMPMSRVLEQMIPVSPGSFDVRHVH